MTSGLVLIIVGLITVFGGFIYAAKNMSNVMSKDKELNFEAVSGNHLKAMVAVVFGGLLTFVGLAITVLPPLVKYLSR